MGRKTTIYAKTAKIKNGWQWVFPASLLYIKTLGFHPNIDRYFQQVPQEFRLQLDPRLRAQTLTVRIFRNIQGSHIRLHQDQGLSLAPPLLFARRSQGC
jgi:hypothetical protein